MFQLSPFTLTSHLPVGLASDVAAAMEHDAPKQTADAWLGTENGMTELENRSPQPLQDA